MSSDINVIDAVVVAIQGTDIDPTTPADGQVLTYDNADGYWAPRSPTVSGLRKDYFTTSGTWTCPDGVTNIICIGAGGGGGGGGGGGNPASSSSGTGGGGGGASIQQTQYATVSPGTNYTITIGAGGTGGAGAIFSVTIWADNGIDGSPTTMTHSGTNYFYALGGGGGGGIDIHNSNVNNPFIGGAPFAGILDRGGWADQTTNGTSFMPGVAGCGGSNFGTLYPSAYTNGSANLVGGYAGGTAGSPASGSANGASGGGGAGPQGPGANGGNGSTGSNGSNGSSASANTGAGGGGGGSANGHGTGGNGGSGGSGYLYILY